MTAVRYYDTRSVVDAIERDWSEHGAPYVLRLDRAKMHLAEALRDLADGYGVLLLFGPPHHPQFYGSSSAATVKYARSNGNRHRLRRRFTYGQARFDAP